MPKIMSSSIPSQHMGVHVWEITSSSTCGCMREVISSTCGCMREVISSTWGCMREIISSTCGCMGDHQQHMRMHAGDDLLVSAGGMPLSLATRSTCGARLKAACGNDAPCGPAVLVTWRHAIVSGDEICMQSTAEGGHKLCIRPAKDAPAVSGRVAACDGDARLGEGRRDAILVDQLGDRAARSVTQGRHQRTGIHAGEPLRLIAQAFL